MSDWKIVKLGDVITFQRGYDLPKSKMIAGIYPVVGSNGIIGYHNQFTTESPSITIGRSGNVGKPFIYYGKSWSHNTTLFIKEFRNVYPQFIYYFLKTLNLNHYAGGTAVPTLNRNHIHNLEVKLPPLETQKKIAAVLSALDDKIELNNAINKNLEEQAQAIFKSWFIDFEPFGGTMPDDWRVINLGSVTDNVRERITNFNTPVFSAVNTGHLVLSDDFFSKRVYSKDIKKYLSVREGDFAYNPARINIGSIGLNDFGYEGCVSPVYVVVRVNENYKSFFRFYFKSTNFIEECMSRGSGSVRQTLNYDDFSLIELVYPADDYAKKFNNLWNEYFYTIRKIELENKKLGEIRDALLPRLMSGEIDVSAVTI